ncbi:MAG: hypothetical protein JNM68_15285 [Dinghuibacter sp.]|nr:hypothetical protein [Dinghuibacter sp.]
MHKFQKKETGKAPIVQKKKAIMPVSLTDNRPQTTVQQKKVEGMNKTGIIQRVVQSRVLPMMDGSSKTEYYSTFDAGTSFNTEEQAWQHDEHFEGQRKADFHYEKRYATPYTYHQTDSYNVVGNGEGRWGPHTVAHGWMSVNMKTQIGKGVTPQQLFADQVLHPDAVAAILQKEYANALNKYQYERYMNDYKILYKRLDALLKTDVANTNPTLAFELLMRIMQMNPYTTYGKSKVKKAATKNKGESNTAKFEESIDGRGKWNDKDGYQQYLTTRKKLE